MRVVLKFEHGSESPGGLVTHTDNGAHLRVSDSVGLGKFPGDAEFSALMQKFSSVTSIGIKKKVSFYQSPLG